MKRGLRGPFFVSAAAVLDARRPQAIARGGGGGQGARRTARQAGIRRFAGYRRSAAPVTSALRVAGSREAFRREECRDRVEREVPALGLLEVAGVARLHRRGKVPRGLAPERGLELSHGTPPSARASRTGAGRSPPPLP